MKIKKFLEENSTDELVELRQQFYQLIASDWAKHEDDYPYIEQTVDDCIELVKQYLKKIGKE
jgi:hypothetical protein